MGLYSSNNGQLESDSFEAIFEDIEITTTGNQQTTLNRVNADGATIHSVDSGPDWSEDSREAPCPYLHDLGSNSTASFPTVEPGPLVPADVPSLLFQSEPNDLAGIPDMAKSLPAHQTGFYQVQLFTGSGCACIDKVGKRNYDVAIEGQGLPCLNDLDLVAIFGNGIGGVVSSTVEVTDDTIDLVYISGKQRPTVNAIEITLLTKLTFGAAALSATVDSDEVPWSSSLPNSFQVTNRGAKRVARVHVEVTDALFLDTVSNPSGLACDTISRPLRIVDSGGTGVVDPATYLPYQGGGGDAGYQGSVLLFDEQTDGGFEPGETLGFSVDVAPISIAGGLCATLDTGASPAWDVSGVSGAELIGALLKVELEDGSMAAGHLHGDNHQVSAQGLASQASPVRTARLTVNRLAAGEAGNQDTVYRYENGTSTTADRLSAAALHPLTTANSLGAAFDRDWLEWRWPAASHDDRVEVNDEHQLSLIGIARLADPLADAPVAKVSKHERLAAPAVDTTHARQRESPAPWLLDELVEQVGEDSLP